MVSSDDASGGLRAEHQHDGHVVGQVGREGGGVVKRAGMGETW